MNSELDQFDISILTHLAKDGRMSFTDLSQRIGLSKTPCLIRVRRLEAEGFIKGYKGNPQPRETWSGACRLHRGELSDTSEPALQAFNKAVMGIPEIEQCHMIAGRFDYLLKVRTKDIKNYRRILGDEISRLPHVSNTSTYVSMQEVKDGKS